MHDSVKKYKKNQFSLRVGVVTAVIGTRQKTTPTPALTVNNVRQPILGLPGNVDASSFQ